MADEVPADLQEKAAIMREFARLRAAGEPVPPEFYTRFVNAANDNYRSGPEAGQRIPEFALPDQKGDTRSLANMAGPHGLLLVFHRSAEW